MLNDASPGGAELFARPIRSGSAVSPPGRAEDVPAAVDRLLDAAVAAHASDLHIRPTGTGLELAWRLDGVLAPLAVWPRDWAANVVARLKVLSRLLTYRTELPQEGRLQFSRPDIEMRLSTFPTLHGEKAVVRMFVGSGQYRYLDDLELPAGMADAVRQQLAETAGVFIITGPAGSGKTTSAYACLRDIQQRSAGMRSLVTLEDPIEAELPGVSQTQVHRPAEFTYPLGLRSLLRQDPDVIFVGEIRDRETAATAFQAGLAGHLVLTTFHAGRAAEAIVRLMDLGVEPYLVRAGLRGVLCQRLLRRLCACSADDAPPHSPRGCAECWQTGYRGRHVIAELFSATAVQAAAATSKSLDEWESAGTSCGMIPLGTRALHAEAAGKTSREEIVRVLGTVSEPILERS